MYSISNSPFDFSSVSLWLPYLPAFFQALTVTHVERALAIEASRRFSTSQSADPAQVVGPRLVAMLSVMNLVGRSDMCKETAVMTTSAQL